MFACCGSKRSLLTKLLVGIVNENYKLSDQTDFYGMVSPFVAFYRWSGLLRVRVRLSIFSNKLAIVFTIFRRGLLQRKRTCVER